MVNTKFHEAYNSMKRRLVRLFNSNWECREMRQENDQMSRNGLLVRRLVA
jgi:hypothetical protein